MNVMEQSYSPTLQIAPPPQNLPLHLLLKHTTLAGSFAHVTSTVIADSIACTEDPHTKLPQLPYTLHMGPPPLLGC